MPFRVGIDLASVASVAESVDRFGERYLERVYTPREVADCTVAGGVSPARLAARFAAKEAVCKALEIDPGTPMPWRAIEVLRAPSGAPRVELAGEAAVAASRWGVVDWRVSLTHEGPLAAAVVLALLT